MSVPEEQLLAALAEKFVVGTATTEEQEQLHQLYDKWIDDEETIVSGTQQTEVLRIEILQVIKGRINSKKRVIPFYKRSAGRVVAAASILIVTTVLFFYYFQSSSKKHELASKHIDLPAKRFLVVPGKDQATLTLANGTKINLDSSGAGLLAQQGNTSIINKDGKVIYDPRKSAGSEMIYNIVSTPRGGQYQLVLSDGTKVWLNATSDLKFPVAFAGNSRKVELTGEAYFEVTKNPEKPFIVSIPPQPGGQAGAQVKVLGTHFNIMAYAEEGKIATTLLEGSVHVSTAQSPTGSQQSAILKPGDQAVLTDNSRLTIHENADVEEAVSWKDGKFHFNNADIKLIMRQISRWYDVDVEYRNVSSETYLGGVVSRKEDIRQLLNYFEIAGKVRFTIEGRKVIVSQ